MTTKAIMVKLRRLFLRPTSGVDVIHQIIKVLQSSVHRIDVGKVCDVFAIIHHRRFKDTAEQDDVYSQVLEVAYLFTNTFGWDMEIQIGMLYGAKTLPRPTCIHTMFNHKQGFGITPQLGILQPIIQRGVTVQSMNWWSNYRAQQ